MKRTLSIKSSVIISIAIVLVSFTLGVRQQSRIENLRSEQQSLEQKLAESGEFSEAGTIRSADIRKRTDHAAEARRAMSELVALSMEGNESEIDWNRRADLADRIEAMNSTALREAVAWILETDDLDAKLRQRLLHGFLNRLAGKHPVEVIDLINRLETEPPAWLEENQLAGVLKLAAGLWAERQPAAAWEWVQERMGGADERSRLVWRSTVFQGIGRKHPELLLQLAHEEGVDGIRFLVWPDQTAEEKLAAFTALRRWHVDSGEDRVTFHKAIRELMLHRSYQRPVTFAESTGWVELAGLTPEDMRFLTDRSALDLSYYIDPVETGKWIDWLDGTFPQDWTRGRIDGMFEDHRTGDAARAWLAKQSEDRARRIRGGASSAP